MCLEKHVEDHVPQTQHPGIRGIPLTNNNESFMTLLGKHNLNSECSNPRAIDVEPDNICKQQAASNVAFCCFIS